MPYLHWDTVACLSEREKALEIIRSNKVPEKVRKAHEEAANDPRLRFTSASILSTPPMHLPLLLDQFRHPSITFPHDRVRAQFIPKQTAGQRTPAKTLVVNHLWLFVPEKGGPYRAIQRYATDDRTDSVVTFFHRKEPGGDIKIDQICDLENTILGDLSSICQPSESFTDIYDMCSLIMSVACTIMLSRITRPDFHFRLLYSQAVGNLVSHPALEMLHGLITMHRDRSI